MTALTELDLAARAATWAAAGVALGVAHLALLRLDVELWLRRRGWAAPVGLHVLRLAAVAGAFLLLARRGALPLLAALAGFGASHLLLALRRPRAFAAPRRPP